MKAAVPLVLALLAMKLPFGLTPESIKTMMTPLKNHPAAMPAGTVPVQGCVPSMGYHYAFPKDLPMGPIGEVVLSARKKFG